MTQVIQHSEKNKLKKLEYNNFNNNISNSHLYLFEFGTLKKVLTHGVILYHYSYNEQYDLYFNWKHSSLYIVFEIAK